MNKALMISIQPQHVVNVMNGDKDRELRTWIPKGYVGPVYVYVTKNGDNLIHNGRAYVLEKGKRLSYDLNGKVAFRFWFDEFDYIWYHSYHDFAGFVVKESDGGNGPIGYKDPVLDKLCLSHEDLGKYYKGKVLYAWHIKKLEIFDNPKELRDFYKYDKKWSKHYKNWLRIGCQDDLNKFRLTKPPQRSVWVYV